GLFVRMPQVQDSKDGALVITARACGCRRDPFACIFRLFTCTVCLYDRNGIHTSGPENGQERPETFNREIFPCFFPSTYLTLRIKGLKIELLSFENNYGTVA